jgi:hypothetical protein
MIAKYILLPIGTVLLWLIFAVFFAASALYMLSLAIVCTVADLAVRALLFVLFVGHMPDAVRGYIYGPLCAHDIPDGMLGYAEGGG